MNSNDSRLPVEPDDAEPRYPTRAEALETVKRRVEEVERRAQAEAKREAANRRRSPWEFNPDSNTGFWYDMFGARMFLSIGLSVIWLLISSLLWLAENLRWPTYYLFRMLDAATGARAFPNAPWLLWTVWGAIFGGALGYWLVEPSYGDRDNRSFVVLAPLLAMVVIGALVWAFVR